MLGERASGVSVARAMPNAYSRQVQPTLCGWHAGLECDEPDEMTDGLHGDI